MNIEEYRKLVENNEEMNRAIEFTSSINAISNILISKEICSRKQLEEDKEAYKNLLITNSFKRESKEDLETVKRMHDLFGCLYKKGE